MRPELYRKDYFKYSFYVPVQDAVKVRPISLRYDHRSRLTTYPFENRARNPHRFLYSFSRNAAASREYSPRLLPTSVDRSPALGVLENSVILLALT